MQQAQVQQLLQQGGSAFGQGNLQLAEKCCTAVLETFPKEANALHLRALIYKKSNRPQEAALTFRSAQKAAPNNAEIANNFGNLLRETGDNAGAINQYDKAIASNSKFAEPWFNKGLTLQSTGNHNEALVAFEKAAKLKPNDARFGNAAGLSLKELGRLDEAVEAYKQTLEINPNHYRALHNLGTTLRLQDRQSEALTYIEKAIKLEPRLAELRYNLANNLYDLGHHEQADEEYRRAIALKPDYLDAHETLNQMYWEHGKRDLFAKSYTVGIKQVPMSAPLRDAHIKALELAGDVEGANEALDAALADVGADAILLRRKARLVSEVGDMDAAVHYFEKAVESGPDEKPIRIDFAQILIQLGRYEDALAHLDAAEAQSPNDQEMWALRGLCWRLLGDKRESWLNDYDTFVQPRRIETPQGYDNIEEFLSELSRAVCAMHVTQVRPLEQTLRGGTQTPGRLFFRPVPIIQTLKQQLEKEISAYIAAMPDDSDHPLLSRKRANFKFTGSWSVRLSKDGFHVNHIHPAGWISSAFYVEVPPCLSETDYSKGNQGWIKFGESGLSLGPEREVIRKLVKPEPGMLALFPSYVWHGTIPFSDDATRITTPFDVVPD